MMEYAVARVRGYRSHLLGMRGIAQLAAQPDLRARVDLLHRMGLLEGHHVSLHEVERELRARLERDMRRVDGLLAGSRARNRLRAILAIRDAWTLKTILRGVDRSEPPAKLLELLLPTLELDDPAIKELSARRGVKAVLDLLATWGSPYAAPLLEVARRSPKHVDLPALEAALDRFVLHRAVAQCQGDPDAAALVAGMVDLANVATLLKVSGKSAAPSLFIEGGRALPQRRFARLVTRPAAEVQAALATDHALHLEEVFAAGKVDALRLERLLSRRPLAALRTAARTHPLSLCVPLLYLLDRQEEVRAIRLVLEGGELGLPAGELLDWAEAA